MSVVSSSKQPRIVNDALQMDNTDAQKAVTNLTQQFMLRKEKEADEKRKETELLAKKAEEEVAEAKAKAEKEKAAKAAQASAAKDKKLKQAAMEYNMKINKEVARRASLSSEKGGSVGDNTPTGGNDLPTKSRMLSNNTDSLGQTTEGDGVAAIEGRKSSLSIGADGGDIPPSAGGEAGSTTEEKGSTSQVSNEGEKNAGDNVKNKENSVENPAEVTGGIMGLLRRRSSANNTAKGSVKGSPVDRRSSWAKIRKETSKKATAKSLARVFAPNLLSKEQNEKGGPANRLQDPGVVEHTTTPRPKTLETQRKPVRPLPRFMVNGPLPSLVGCEGVPKSKHEDMVWKNAVRAHARSRRAEKVAMLLSGKEEVMSDSETDEDEKSKIEEAIFRLKGTSISFEDEILDESMYHVDHFSDDDSSTDSGIVYVRSKWKENEFGQIVKAGVDDQANARKSRKEKDRQKKLAEAERQKELELLRMKEKEEVQKKKMDLRGPGAFNRKLRAIESLEEEKKKKIEAKKKLEREKHAPTAVLSRNMSRLDMEQYEQLVLEYNVDFDKLFDRIEMKLSGIPDNRNADSGTYEDNREMKFTETTANVEQDLQVLLPFVVKIQAYFRGRLGRKKAKQVKKYKEKRHKEISARLDKQKVKDRTIDMAYKLNIDPFKNPQLLWIAELAQQEKIPDGWKVVATVDGDKEYVNESLDMRTFEHPIVTKYRTIIRTLRYEAAVKIQKISRAWLAKRIVDDVRQDRRTSVNSRLDNRDRQAELEAEQDKTNVPGFVLEIVRGLVNERLGGKIPLLPP